MRRVPDPGLSYEVFRPVTEEKSYRTLQAIYASVASVVRDGTKHPPAISYFSDFALTLHEDANLTHDSRALLQPMHSRLFYNNFKNGAEAVSLPDVATCSTWKPWVMHNKLADVVLFGIAPRDEADGTKFHVESASTSMILARMGLETAEGITTDPRVLLGMAQGMATYTALQDALQHRLRRPPTIEFGTPSIVVQHAEVHTPFGHDFGLNQEY